MKTEFLTYVVKSQKMAGFLMLRGFKLHGLEKGRVDENRNVFFFTNSKELQTAIEIYKQAN
jgi:hypothetical protein